MFQRPYGFTRRNHLITAEDIDGVGDDSYSPPDTGWLGQVVQDSNTIYFRRVGNLVSFKLDGDLTGVTSTLENSESDPFVIPAGFRPSGPVDHDPSWVTATGWDSDGGGLITIVLYGGTEGNIAVEGATEVSSAGMGIAKYAVNYLTTNPFPSSEELSDWTPAVDGGPS